jgi:hypothetical protein
VRGQPLLALQAPQRAYLVALHRVDTRRAVLRSADVQPAGGQLDLRPLQIAQFGRPQAVAVAEQYLVASRCPQRLNLRAAACNRSTSAAVRYSRVLTEEFTMVGASRLTSDLSAVWTVILGATRELMLLSSLVSIGEPQPAPRGSNLAIGIDASEINGPVWSVSGRGTTGAFRSSRTDRGA